VVGRQKQMSIIRRSCITSAQGTGQWNSS